MGVRLDGAVDWKQVGGLLEDGHGLSVPKKKTRTKTGTTGTKRSAKTTPPKRKRTRGAHPRAS